jgi:dienelactone hydrolase
VSHTGLCLVAFIWLAACTESCSSHRDTTYNGAQIEAHPTQDHTVRVAFKTAEGSDNLTGELILPSGAGPFPAVVVMIPTMCEGYVVIPDSWQRVILPSWGYATLMIDSFATRGLKVSACRDFSVLQPSQTVGDAYGALEFLKSRPNIDANRIALVGFGGQGTTALLSDTTEARDRYLPGGENGFRAVFAFYPYCNVEFSKEIPRAYAPERIFAGERDDISPATRCVELAEHFRTRGADVQVTVYPRAEAGFDIVPSDTNYEVQDPTAIHPGSTTVSTHPQYDPWGENLSSCTFKVASVFDLAKRSDANACLRHGVHFQGDATIAEQAKSDLRNGLAALMKQR